MVNLLTAPSSLLGADKGFQTLSVVRGQKIAYPAYSDAELAAGKVVSPDRSYTPQQLPSTT